MKNNIKFYFNCRFALSICRKDLNDITEELAILFGPISDLNDYFNQLTDDKKALIVKNEDLKPHEKLKFELKNLSNTPNNILKMQYYSLCRYQLNETPANIILELNELFGDEAPNISVLNCWIINNWSELIPFDAMTIETIDDELILSDDMNKNLDFSKNQISLLHDRIQQLTNENNNLKRVNLNLKNENIDALKLGNDYITSLVDSFNTKLNSANNSSSLKRIERLEHELLRVNDLRHSLKRQLSEIQAVSDSQHIRVLQLSSENQILSQQLQLANFDFATQQKEIIKHKNINSELKQELNEFKAEIVQFNEKYKPDIDPKLVAKNHLLKIKLKKVIDSLIKSKANFKKLKNDLISNKTCLKDLLLDLMQQIKDNSLNIEINKENLSNNYYKEIKSIVKRIIASLKRSEADDLLKKVHKLYFELFDKNIANDKSIDVYLDEIKRLFYKLRKLEISNNAEIERLNESNKSLTIENEQQKFRDFKQVDLISGFRDRVSFEPEIIDLTSEETQQNEIFWRDISEPSHGGKKFKIF